MDKKVIMRVARPSNNLELISKMYIQGLDFEKLGGFEDHDGFDGVIVGHKNHAYHLEFTKQEDTTSELPPSKENLLIFYLGDSQQWKNTCLKMIKIGFKEVVSTNPYWEKHGKTFEDPDGYRIVLQNKSWDL